LVKSSRTNDGRIQDIGTIGGSDNENILASANTINFCENLVDHTITSFTATSTSC
jgi:hypothetical protein